MTEEIIRMAREAGLHRQQHNLMSNPIQYRYRYDGYEENLERFAALVAAAEREECAKVCEAEERRILSKQSGRESDQVDTNLRMIACVLPDIAAAIRARGQA